MTDFSKVVIPVFLLIVIVYGFHKKVDLYDSFLVGAKEGLQMCFSIFPTILAMVFAINIFLDSNILAEFFGFLTPFLKKFSLPYEILPMAFLRPISGSATLTIMNDILIKYGPDSFVGNMSSILQGCTDTTLYVLALYFGSVKIYKTKYALKVGLFADFVGILLAVILTLIFFS